MKKMFFTALGALLAGGAFSQEPGYKQALGLKVPGGFSVSYKNFINNTQNIELQAMYWKKGFRFVGLYEFNFYSFDVEGLSWFVGPGAHIGFWKKKYQEDYNSSADLGIDGIIGLDYKFKDLPLNVSLDWQPSITLAGHSSVTPVYGGLGVWYTF